MAALSSLNEVEVGTAVALNSSGDRYERWTRTETGLVSTDGVELDEWFFTGWLAEGRLFLRDYTPPQVGDWFIDSRGGRWHYLVAEVDGSTARCALFRTGSFHSIFAIADMQDTYTRCQTPDWAGGAEQSLVSMAIRLSRVEKLAEQHESYQRRERYLRRDLQYVSTYIAQAMQHLGQE